MSTKSLKSQNSAWLWAVLLADIAVCITIASPLIGSDPFEATSAMVKRYSLAGIAPVVVLLLSSLLSRDIKAILVYWRLHDVTPGHRAFSVHAPADPRIDLTVLEKNVGTFPTLPREQNSQWYKLYKKVENEISVLDAHKAYLLFRDLAAISFILSFVIGVAFWALINVQVGLLGFGFLSIQFFLTAVAARQNGNAMVKNVLALHFAKRRR